MIERQKDKYKWEFIFLGANIDAISTAARFGIDADRAANYHSDSEGTRLNYEAVSCFVSEIQSDRPIDEKWKAKIDSDFDNRNKKGEK